LGGQAIFYPKMYEKLYQLPEYYTIFAGKNISRPSLGACLLCL